MNKIKYYSQAFLFMRLVIEIQNDSKGDKGEMKSRAKELSSIFPHCNLFSFSFCNIKFFLHVNLTLPLKFSLYTLNSLSHLGI